jgi:DMSO/TMAO reductase YedYZ heme-binding membrane subunit
MLVFVRRALTVSCVFSAMLMGLSFYAQDFLSILIYCVVVLTLFRLRSKVARKLWAQRRAQQATLVPTKVAGA